MYDFQKHLYSDEIILYQGRPVPGKGSKQIAGTLFLIFFVLIMQGLLIWSVVTKTGDGANGINLSFIIIFLVLTFFLLLGLYTLVYNLFIKKVQVADDFYCLTNKRALKYESKTNKLVFGYLGNYEDIRCLNIKNNFGDLYMGIVLKKDYENNKETSLEEIKEIKTFMMNPDSQNMPIINFESIENPEYVMDLAQKARRDILLKDNQ